MTGPRQNDRLMFRSAGLLPGSGSAAIWHFRHVMVDDASSANEVALAGVYSMAPANRTIAHWPAIRILESGLDRRDRDHLNPDNHHTVALSPDLPGQLRDDAEPGYTEGREQDSQKGLGWQGAWAVRLLELQARKQSLGERTEIIWNSQHDPTWGVQVRLHAVKVVARKDDEHEVDEEDDVMSPGISDYDVRATILQVFVKSEEIAYLRQPDEEDEEEEEEESGSEDEY
ncbi:hypothetical protein B0H17DRAFT_1183229 [Mycena rosella]|uniref:Uncharacterized protein n=1 Tax=Mycena rosella TaxID=1033263 RepID=A0AAD7D0T3_MYCRO|nr:hypothetical protein B0H17DRAFT_1183229 [Mycena rosella]